MTNVKSAKKKVQRGHVTGGGAGRGGPCGRGERGHNGGEDHVGALGGIHVAVDTPAAVVLDQRRRLAVVRVQPRAQGCLVVVTAADQGLAGHLGWKGRTAPPDPQPKKVEKIRLAFSGYLGNCRLKL